jgi:4-amino-4-deoxy-L-arabinose transferase-like glycosyltransferase
MRARFSDAQCGFKAGRTEVVQALLPAVEDQADPGPAGPAACGAGPRTRPGPGFGVSSWSLLASQALMGVATVALLYGCVRRWFGPPAGLVAGAVIALTPVATLIFRFNNPDALLVLLLVAGAYAVVRALEGGSTRWLVLAGAFVGFGFLAKQLQALLVVPAFGLVYLAAAPGSLGRRLGQLVAAGAAMVASAGWWVAIVELLPASARPYVHYFLGGGRMGGRSMGSSDAAQQMGAWVAESFTATSVGGATVYDLTAR